MLLIGNAMGREKAFCTSKFLAESMAKPTVFCRAQGVLIHYLYTALALWFVIYCIKLVQVDVHLSTKHCHHSLRYLTVPITSSNTCSFLGKGRLTEDRKNLKLKLKMCNFIIMIAYDLYIIQ